jgi:hypothetical protein
MLRRVLVLGVATAIVASGSVDLSACGDKFLRIGRSSRLDGYAAVHPSSILLFVPKHSKPSGVKDFESAFKRAGHRFQAVATIEAFSSALAAGGIDIVIAGMDDAARLRPHAERASSRPDLLPLVHKPSRAVLAGLEQQYGHVLKLPAFRYEALEEIDHVMALRLKVASGLNH